MTRDELIALAKRYVEVPHTWCLSHEDAPWLARAFLEADADRVRLRKHDRAQYEDRGRMQRRINELEEDAHHHGNVVRNLIDERDAARAEVERLRELEARYLRLMSIRRPDRHEELCVCDRCLSVMFGKRVSQLEPERDALRAEIENARRVYAAQGDALVWHVRRDDGDIGYYDTHRARLVRIEKIDAPKGER